MPSKSDKQKRTMAAAAHNSKEFADKVGIPQKVAKEFNEADTKKGGKHGKGNKPKPSKSRPAPLQALRDRNSKSNLKPSQRKENRCHQINRQQSRGMVDETIVRRVTVMILWNQSHQI